MVGTDQLNAPAIERVLALCHVSEQLPKSLKNTFGGWPTHYFLSHSTQMSFLVGPGCLLLFPSGS